MGSVTQFNERIRFVPPQLSADDDILSAARGIARRCGVEARQQVREAISHSGLLALSVPADMGGADVTNDLLAQVVSIVAEADADVSRRLADHFTALEFVRSAGSEDQRRALFARAGLGEIFALAEGVADPEQPVLLGEDLGFWASGERLAPTYPDVDWIVMPAFNYLRQAVLVVVRNRRPALADGQLRADDLLPLAQDTESLPVSVATLLRAAVALGQTQREFSGLIAQGLANENVSQSKIGEAYLTAELLKAQIARVGAMIDAVQVGADNVTARSVRHNAVTLDILMTRMGLADADCASNLIESLGGDLCRQ